MKQNVWKLSRQYTPQIKSQWGVRRGKIALNFFLPFVVVIKIPFVKKCNVLMKEARVVRTMRRERRGKSNSQIKLWHSIRRGSNLKNRGMKSLLGNCLIEAREREEEKSFVNLKHLHIKKEFQIDNSAANGMSERY